MRGRRRRDPDDVVLDEKASVHGVEQCGERHRVELPVGNDRDLTNAGELRPHQRVWPQGHSVATGQTETLAITIPGNVLAIGFFNLYVEDDTAVVSAVLTLEGCCLNR